MKRLTALVAASLAGLAGLVGCGPPSPPSAVNAVLAIDPNHAASADTVVVVRMKTGHEYASTRKGNWVIHWRLEGGEVLKVEKGTWPHTTLDFVAHDSWPTLESGILVSKELWPYRPGIVYAFDLDTTAKPARIVARRSRSSLPPYGEIKPFWPQKGLPKGQSRYERVQAAVAEYCKKSRLDCSGSWREEEVQVDGASKYAVLVTRPTDYLILIVDPETMAVSQYQAEDKK